MFETQQSPTSNITISSTRLDETHVSMVSIMLEQISDFFPKPIILSAKQQPIERFRNLAAAISNAVYEQSIDRCVRT